MHAYYMSKERNNHCIKINSVDKRGFISISVGHHRGMNKVREEIIERDFVPCTFEYFRSMRIAEGERRKKEEHGRK